ncbi:hypothetical protein BGZ73_002006 [Actinomortierella ambigua]|nr:hypothetical protein BGZ73_002006 [Actinomortierella ambigua]
MDDDDPKNDAVDRVPALKISAEGATSTIVDITQDRSTTLLFTWDKDILDGSRLASYGQMLQHKEPIVVRIDNLTLTSLTTKWVHVPQAPWFRGWKRHVDEKLILDDISLHFPPGELTAILGASGAGKTSLLSTILSRHPSNARISGDIWFNGSKNPSLSKVNTACGYVRQEHSFLLTHLTARETLQYAAELSMDKRLTKAEKFARVEAIMEFMGLLECADVVIGGAETVGCSGGQQRRVSIAMQLITEPACLVLDEPTTGLDSMAALGILQTLKAIAKTGRTVICCVHQPGPAIWNELDNVVLMMHGGRLGYTGKRADTLEYFKALGYTPPEHVNILDFILDTASINYQSSESEALSRRRVDELAAHFRQHRSKIRIESSMDKENTDCPTLSQAHTSNLPALGKRTQHQASLLQITGILSRRSFTNTFRQKGLFFNRIFLPLGMAIMSEPFFSGMDYSPAGLLERLTYAMHLNFYVMVGFFTCASLFPRERNLAFYEISNGAYGVTPFFFSYMVNELPLNLLAAGIVVACSYWIVPVKQDIESLALLYFVSLVFMTLGETLAITICAWTSNDGIMINITSSICTFLSLMAGTTVADMPKIFQWINRGSLMKYGAAAIAVSELKDMEVNCTNEQERALECLIKTGDDVLRHIHFHRLTITECVVMMAVLTIVYRAIAWLSLMTKVWLLRR